PPYNSATRHPVFFGSSLRQSPFPMGAALGHEVSPVAHGYIFHEGRPGTGSGGQTKL
ncbi:hypothetical protein BDY21DRAFT_275382, partial [Lineolata rhizophorae]